MNLRCYKSVEDFASLGPGTVASFVPALLGRNLSEELIVILTGPQGPDHYSMWPLTHLDTQHGCDGIETALDPISATGIWLIGSSAGLPNVAAAVAGLLDFLDGSTKWSSSWKALAVIADGDRWGYVGDHVDVIECSELHAVPDLDPLWGRLTAVAAKVACAKARATTALDLELNTEDEEVLAAERILLQLRTRVPEEVNARQREEDEASLLGAFHAGGPVTVAEAVNLGCALEAGAQLQEMAIEWILTAAPERVGARLWCQIARYTTGSRRSFAATLAGAAAWRTGGLLTANAAIGVAYPDRRQQPAARSLAELVWTGVSAEALIPTAPAEEA